MPQDFALQHEPVTNLFPRLRPEDWGRYALTPAQLAHYHEHGFVGGIRMLDDAHLETLGNELARLVDADAPLRGLFHEYHSNE